MEGIRIKANKRITIILFMALAVVAASAAAAGAAGGVSLNCKGSDVRDVLRGLGERCAVSIIIDPSVSGQVTMTLSDVSFETALTAVCEASHLTFIKEGSVYRVVKVSYSVSYRDGLLTIQAGDADLSGLWQEIAKQANVSIVPDRGLTGKATLMVFDLPVDQAVAVLAQASECVVEKRDGVFYVHPSYTPSSVNVKVQYHDGRLSVEARDADIQDVVRQLTLQTGVTIAVDANVAGKVNTTFKDLALLQGLRTLFEGNGLRLLPVDKDYYRVSRSDGFLFVRYQDAKLSMDVRNVALDTVVEELALQTKLNFLAEKDLGVKVSGSFQGLGLSAGLDTFFKANGLSLEQRGGVYYISRAGEDRGVTVGLHDDGRLDIDATNAPLSTVLREIAARTGINLILYSSVNWLVNDVQLHGVTLEEGLNLMLMGTSYSWRKTGDTFVVADGISLRPDSLDFLEAGIIPCRNLTAESLFNILPPYLPQSNFRVIKEQNVLVVTGASSFIARAREFVSLVDRPAGDVTSEVIRLNNTRVDDVLKLIPASIPKADILVLREANSLVVTGTKAYIAQVQDYIAKIDLPAPLILFDVLVLQVNHNKNLTTSTNLSFQYGNVMVKLGGGLTEVSVVATPRVGVTAGLSALLEQGLVEVLANPKIATLSGHQATFGVVTKHRYAISETSPSSGTGQSQPATSIQTVDAGIDLTLSPWVSGDRQITLEIKPKISEYSGTLDPTPGAVTLPTTNERSTETTVRVRDGQTIIISGLIQKSTRKSVFKVPILGDIPLIGLLFRTTRMLTENTEFIIMVRPTLIEDPSEMDQYMGELSGLLKQPEDNKGSQPTEDAAPEPPRPVGPDRRPRPPVD